MENIKVFRNLYVTINDKTIKDIVLDIIEKELDPKFKRRQCSLDSCVEFQMAGDFIG